jgi:hypothetical protein
MTHSRAFLALAILLGFAVLPAHALYPQWTRIDLLSKTEVKDVASIDFNGDGRADVVTRMGDQTVLVWMTAADGTLSRTPVTAYVGQGVADVAVGDATGDGKPDLIIADRSIGRLAVVPSNGDGPLQAAIITSQLWASPEQLLTGDFNRDGKLDVAVFSILGSAAMVLAGDGTGRFGTELWRKFGISDGIRMAAGDLDGDGKLDLLFARKVPETPTQYELYYGAGDGTFDAPVTMASPAGISRVVLADLDADGDAEIVSCEFEPKTLSVIVNNGSRTFGAAMPYAVGSTQFGDPLDVMARDFTGDGKVDVVVTLPNSRQLATFPGNGNGSLSAPVLTLVPRHSTTSAMLVYYLAAGDYDGDGRVDLATFDAKGIALFRNQAGDATLELKAQYPTITAGTSAKMLLTLYAASYYAYPFSVNGPPATGTVTLKEGAVTLATGTLQANSATIEVPSLAAGTHQITAYFGGDDLYSAVTSATITQTVTAEKTTTTLVSSVAGTVVSYAEQWRLTATVTSPLAGPLTGELWLFSDGVRSQNSRSGPTGYWDIQRTTPGTHEYYVTFEGTDTQPPSRSEILRQSAKKANSVTGIDYGGTTRVIRYGDHPEVRVHLNSEPWGEVPGGNVRLYDGTTLLATTFADNQCCTGGMDVTFALPLLAAGTHYVRAVYEGSANFESSQSPFVRFEVLPAGGFPLDVYTLGGSIIAADGFYTLPEGGHYDIYRRIGTGPWILIGASSSSPSDRVYDAQPLTPYAFRMEAFDSTNVKIAASNVDVAMIVPLFDTPLLPGARVQAKQVKDLVDAVNALRAGVNLAPISIADAGSGQKIKTAHLTKLRTAVNEARAAFGAPAMTFAADGTVVRARHLQDLRDALQ